MKKALNIVQGHLVSGVHGADALVACFISAVKDFLPFPSDYVDKKLKNPSPTHLMAKVKAHLIAIETDCPVITEVLHMLYGKGNWPDAGGSASSGCIVIRAYHPPLQHHVMSSITHRGNEVETMRGKRGQ